MLLSDSSEIIVSVSTLTVADLAGVVYSSGKVFNGLSTGRLDTENFLRSGSTDGIASRADLALLEDLRDAAQFILDHRGRTVDAAFVSSLNAALSRSAAVHPGQLRTPGQQIGVSTRSGRHEPAACTGTELQILISGADEALELFVALAAAQPFEDGNKRTALFAANAALLAGGTGQLLIVPVDLSDQFNDLLARAYIYGEHAGVKDLLRHHGLVPVP